jgi:hypothetical protein
MVVFKVISPDELTYKQAMEGEDRELWIIAVEKELQSFKSNKTWTLVMFPHNKKALSMKWLLRLKRNLAGSIIKYKARLNVRGFEQIQGVDYTETFAPVTKLTSLRLFLAMANQFCMRMIQLDITTAFLNAKLDEEIYVDIPPGVDIEEELKQLLSHHPMQKMDRSKLAFRLLKSVYGLKQAPRMWYEKINNYITSLGYVPLKSEPCIYIYILQTQLSKSMITLYVDDMIIASTQASELNRVVDGLCK